MADKGTGSAAGGIYKDSDSALASACKDVASECAQDYQENVAWRHQGGTVPEDGKLTKAHKGVNFSTSKAQEMGGKETFAGDLGGSGGKSEY